MKSKILDVEINEKTFKGISITGAILILFFCLALYFDLGALKNYKIPKDIKLDKNAKIEFRIDKIVPSNKYIEIEGWAYKKGQKVDYFNSKFILQNEETKKYKALHTEMKNVEYLLSVDDKYDCTRAGMYAKSIAVLLKRGDYRIFIEYKNDDENILVDTGEVFKY